MDWDERVNLVEKPLSFLLLAAAATAAALVISLQKQAVYFSFDLKSRDTLICRSNIDFAVSRMLF
jgi:hypothetical protein